MLLIERYKHTASQLAEEPAVITVEGVHTFGQLNERAIRVASSLAKRGIGQGDRVAIRLPRGFRFVACMIGVMLSGASYTPLDAHLPIPYVEKVFKQLSPHLTIIEPDTKIFGDDKEVLFDDLASNESLQFTAPKKDTPAYTIFTSGSTGEPKGVVISHGALACFTDWCTTEFSPYTRLPLLNVANFSFDQSVLDIVMLMAAGCPMVCLSGTPTIMDLVGAMEQYEVAFISTVPSTFSILLSAPALLRRFSLEHLRCVVLGGAAFPEATRKQLFSWKPELDVYNLYGPTEATVYCLSQKVTADTSSPFPTVALGAPFPGMQAYLVNEGDQIINGSPADGELVIKGEQVMTKYFNDTKKTCAAFTVNTPELKGGKVYRTGDIVHRDDSGTYYFTGRRDDLIKTSGYRVSLATLEQTALQHSAVAEAGAVAIAEPTIENKLVLSVVLAPQSGTTIKDIDLHLKKALPAYMQPGEIHTLDSLPKNTSGKIDRAALKRMMTTKG